MKSEQPSGTRVREATHSDLPAIARIGAESFSGLRPPERATQWVASCFAAFPRMRYWVAELDGNIVAYILWVEKGGFRDQAVVELEQIAVSPALRGRGIGHELVTESVKSIEQHIRNRGGVLKLVEVTTGSEQHAIDFYRQTLGAEVVAQIPDYFRGDEFVLIARRTKQ